jgi:hypothetical protein
VLCVLTLLAVALFRLLTAQVATPVFDLDPMLAPGGQPGLAPGASLLLDAIALTASALGLLVEWRCGRRVHQWVIVAGLLPALPLIAGEAGFAGGAIEHAWRGATWLSGALGGAALAHLLRDAALRRMALAILLGGLAALAVRGLAQLFVEHPRLMQEYEGLRQAFLADRGWGEGSANRRIFEDRLVQREAVGWFGLSNVFSSAMVVAAILAIALTGGAWGTRRLPRAALVTSLLAVAALALIIVNGSKGAIGALGLGVMVLGLGVVTTIRSVAPARVATALWPCIALVLPVAAVAAIWIRGALLPEDAAGERSLIFRWFYLVDAWRVFWNHPWLGVGPDGVQQAMLLVRDPHHAEEVVSVHNVGADWMVSLGVLGAGWVFLLGTLLWWAGQRVSGSWTGLAPGGLSSGERGAAEPSAARLEYRDAQRLAVAVVLLVALCAAWLESATLDPLLLLLRLVGVVSAASIAAATLVLLAPASSAAQAPHGATHPGPAWPVQRWGVFAAAVALAVLGQIDMTFWLAGSLPWAMATLAIAGLAPQGQGVPQSKADRVGVPLLVAVALGLAMGCAVLGHAAWRVERVLRHASLPLGELGRTQALIDSLGEPPRRLTGADAAALERQLHGAAAPAESVESITRLLASESPQERQIGRRTLTESVRDLEVEARRDVQRALEPILGGRDIRPALVSFDQARRVAVMEPPATRLESLAAALEMLRSLPESTRRDSRLRRAEAELLDALARSGDERAVHQALEAWRSLAAGDPCSFAIQIRLAESAGLADDPAAEVAALTRALELDAARRLDPRRRLSDAQREALSARLRGEDAPAAGRSR